ncbi:hypothetical protein CHCC20375_0352 [Bacillus licheniformis]|nr:hypothetical protein CHCC20375_0352 [Bacillus licheniformis]
MEQAASKYNGSDGNCMKGALKFLIISNLQKPISAISSVS